tara:strand:+ start:52 stop:528 length:477 start_codon:yes stop_codon:yes gene_type:complete
MASITETHTVEWSVSATPKVSLATTAGVNMQTATLHEDIRRSLGGSGSATTDGAIDFGGVSDGATNYLQADNSGTAVVGNGDSTFIWIRHTGYLWSSSSALGAATTDTINVKIDSEVVAALKAGEAWIIPLHGAVSNGSWTVERGGSSDIAIEAIGLD